MSDEPSPLTPRQQRFVDEYLVDLNGAQAAIRAGYAKTSAYSRGAQLLKDPAVKAAIEAGKADRRERLQMTQDGAVLEIATIAYAEVKGDPKHSDKLVALKALLEHLKPAPVPQPTTQASFSVTLSDLANMTDEQLALAISRIDVMVAGISAKPKP